MIRVARRLATVLITGLMASVVLDSCGDRPAQAGIDFGVEGGQPVFVNCGEPLGALDRILVSEVDTERTYLLDAEKGPPFATGDKLTIDPSSWSDVAESNTATVPSGGRMSILVISSSDTRSAMFDIPETGIADGQWVTSGGVIASEPCGAEPSER